MDAEDELAAHQDRDTRRAREQELLSKRADQEERRRISRLERESVWKAERDRREAEVLAEKRRREGERVQYVKDMETWDRDLIFKRESESRETIMKEFRDMERREVRRMMEALQKEKEERARRDREEAYLSQQEALRAEREMTMRAEQERLNMFLQSTAALQAASAEQAVGAHLQTPVYEGPSSSAELLGGRYTNLPLECDEWSVEDVIAWFQRLNLSKDYSNLLRDNNIVGSVLPAMRDRDWKELGIHSLGDRRQLERFIPTLLPATKVAAGLAGVATPGGSRKGSLASADADTGKIDIIKDPAYKETVQKFRDLHQRLKDKDRELQELRKEAEKAHLESSDIVQKAVEQLEDQHRREAELVQYTNRLGHLEFERAKKVQDMVAEENERARELEKLFDDQRQAMLDRDRARSDDYSGALDMARQSVWNRCQQREQDLADQSRTLHALERQRETELKSMLDDQLRVEEEKLRKFEEEEQARIDLIKKRVEEEAHRARDRLDEIAKRDVEISRLEDEITRVRAAQQSGAVPPSLNVPDQSTFTDAEGYDAQVKQHQTQLNELYDRAN
eukprot:NODE_647_length_1882_cov_35.447354_g519_i0.p1 GENE.NODE_647_length_1882_cov_35.447354_g519_i0~~NODE_647_length_1882_cov_35.447354_g519_i0.p1  ORF type:complete len:588 (-),score=212.43 NODE_647_length_1882_cov_35.447354_g519_i0:119-1816(-)